MTNPLYRAHVRSGGLTIFVPELAVSAGDAPGDALRCPRTGGDHPLSPIASHPIPNAPRAISARDSGTREADALAFWLGDKHTPGWIHLHGGLGFHVTDSRGQHMTGFPDILAVLPMRDGSTLLVVLELKCGRDRLRIEQHDALCRFAGCPASFVAVVRYGRKQTNAFGWPGELTQDDAVAAIERMLA